MVIRWFYSFSIVWLFFKGIFRWLVEGVCKCLVYFYIYEVFKLRIRIFIFGWLLLFFELNFVVFKEKGVFLFLI